MLFLCNIYPSDIRDPKIKELMEQYKQRFGKDLEFSSYANYRALGLKAMERAYQEALETALETGKPFEPPDQMAQARALGLIK